MFGKTFGKARAATVESGIPSPTGRLRGQRPQLQKIQIRNNGAGGQAATVAGDDGPGFHTWPSGHIPQNTAPNPLLRIRSTAKKTFGDTFAEARADTIASVFPSPTGRLRGQRPQLQKKPWPLSHIPQTPVTNAVIRIRRIQTLPPTNPLGPHSPASGASFAGDFSRVRRRSSSRVRSSGVNSGRDGLSAVTAGPRSVLFQ